MHKRKKTIPITEGLVVFGFGYKTAVKYVFGKKENGKWRVYIHDGTRKLMFQYGQDTFTNGGTLYKNGLRCYIYTIAKERQWKAIKIKQNVMATLEQMQVIIDRTKRASPAKTLLVSNAIQNFFTEYGKIYKRDGKKDS